MKTIQAFIIGITFFVGVAGCSSPSSKVTRSQHQVSKTAAIVEDGRLLYEMGRLDDAEHKLEAALAIEPENKNAQYYLALVRQARKLSSISSHHQEVIIRPFHSSRFIDMTQWPL